MAADYLVVATGGAPLWIGTASLAVTGGVSAPPSNTVAPAISGTVAVGQTLTCSTGTWTNSPSYAYQWQRATTSGGTYSNVASGGTSSTYVLQTGDATYYFKCVVTATNAAGSASADSNVVGPVAASDPFSLPLYDTSKITYLGRFNLPNDGSALNGTAGLAYGSRNAGIAFNPAGNGGAGSLFISGGPSTYEEVVGEFSIPTPLTSGPYNTATALQALQLTAAGKQNLLQQGTSGTVSSGLMVYNGRLIESWLSFYLTSPPVQTTAYMARTSLTLFGGTATDPVQVGTLTNQRFMSGLGCALPSNWSAAFGGYTAIGGGAGGVSISSNYSCGPAMVLFNPDDITGSGAVSGVELSYYVQGDIDGGFGPFSSLWTNNSFHRGTIVLPESRTFICFGRHGDSVYNAGNESQVQCTTRLWLYDAVDLKDVYDGITSPRAVLPYATYDITDGPNNSVPQGDEIRSATWDPTGRKLYVLAGHEDGSWPAVFVFSVPV